MERHFDSEYFENKESKVGTSEAIKWQKRQMRYGNRSGMDFTDKKMELKTKNSNIVFKNMPDYQKVNSSIVMI